MVLDGSPFVGREIGRDLRRIFLAASLSLIPSHTGNSASQRRFKCGRYISRSRAFMVPLALAASLFLTAQAPSPEPVTDPETELGDAVYKDLRGKAMIIAQFAPVQTSLKPITGTRYGASGRAATLRRIHLKFYLVHDPRPNAFSVPGEGPSTSRTLLCTS